ncbi:protein SanA [Rhodococcoides trifolii]|uniref:Protein SanA n=1 Tax=Rhodococcoides trifolii TaxID=908250 RepID=A0A917D1W6_9NOCA|nr:ElyC/SanA/YdcF family protein [Rhodococcus trifolii]GGG04738.1 protein SanA [Rhodococcus trifolii]
MKTVLARSAVAIVSAAILVVLGSAAWVAYLASGRVHDVAEAPTAPTVIVLGSQVRDGKPMKFLQGRLDAAIELVEAGRASDVLVSGDADGASGNEIAAMTDYLVAAGIDPDAIVGDPHGVDTYDTCARAATTYGIHRALVVTQGLHVSRAVALCREKGIDVDGVDASCDCNRLALLRNYAREWLARPKVVLDLLSGREPATVTTG